MSPSSARRPPTTAAATAAARLFAVVGARVRDARLRRRWTLRELGSRADLSASAVHAIEAGQAGSVDAYARLATALGLRLEIDLVDARQRMPATTRHADPVHSGMCEFEAAHLRPLVTGVAIDEPYQHYQFAGRGDVVAWNATEAALLHIENRTRFPDVQETAGSYNAKRAYLGPTLAERAGVRAWRSETHVIAALWSAEVLHALRLRTNTFRSMCPDPADPFAAWWAGQPPKSGKFSCLVVLDPVATNRQHAFVGLERALVARPRYRGYADAASAMMNRDE